MRSKTKRKKRSLAAPKTRDEIHSNPATATTSRRRAMQRIPRGSPYPPASKHPAYVEISLAQFSQSVKTTNMTHRQTEKLNNGTLYAPRYEGVFLPCRTKTASLLVETQMSRDHLILAAGRVRSKKKTQNKTEIAPHANHPTKSTAAQRPRPS